MKRWTSLAAVGFLLAAACTIEPLEDPGLGELALTSVVYAGDGSILAEFHAAENRVLVEYEDLPATLVDAVVAIEDERFWQHTGVDLQAVARALVENLQDRAVSQGGSTITQQYLKNVVLTPEITLDRKITEAALALRLEQGLDKEDDPRALPQHRLLRQLLIRSRSGISPLLRKGCFRAGPLRSRPRLPA